MGHNRATEGLFSKTSRHSHICGMEVFIYSRSSIPSTFQRLLKDPNGAINTWLSMMSRSPKANDILWECRMLMCLILFDRYPMVFPLAQCLCVVTMKRRVEPHLDLNVVQQWPDTHFIWIMGTWDQFTCCHFASRYLFQEVFSPTHPHHTCISILMSGIHEFTIQPSYCLQPVPFSWDFPITHSYRIWMEDRSSSWSWSQLIDEQKLIAQCDWSPWMTNHWFGSHSLSDGRVVVQITFWLSLDRVDLERSSVQLWSYGLSAQSMQHNLHYKFEVTGTQFLGCP